MNVRYFKNFVKKNGAYLALFLLFLVSASPLLAANCDQECASASDCAESTCPVCIGHCVSCHVLSNQTACTDASTGADTACSWLAAENRCIYPGELPEVNHLWRNILFLVLTVPIVFFGLRRRPRKRR